MSRTRGGEKKKGKEEDFTALGKKERGV